jgi:ribosome biogenesis GTPase
MQLSDLVPYGLSREIADRYRSVLHPAAMPGRIIRIDRGRPQVAVPGGIRSCVVGGHLKDSAVAIGDWVVARDVPGYELVIEEVLERTSAIVRRDPSPGDNRDQVLVANLDEVFVLHRLDRKLNLGSLERYLVMVRDGGTVPVIVLSKADLVSSREAAAAATAAERLAPDVAVFVTSAITEVGLGSLARRLAPERSIGLVGESGSGKSTLVNHLIGTDLLDTGETRRGDGKGKHTTIVRQLVVVPSGGVLIDTPGLRAVGLSRGSAGVSQVFDDVEQLIGSCRFRNCAHGVEPGCAVNEAIAAGDLERRRFDSYVSLQREQSQVAAREAAVARRAEHKRIAINRRKMLRSRGPRDR